MEQRKPDTKEKIVLPENLQREMMKFFMKTSIPKIVERNRRNSENHQTPLSLEEAED
jgi:hypothetical protein